MSRQQSTISSLFFQFEARFGVIQKSDLGTIFFSFTLIRTFYLTKAENRPKKSLMQSVDHYFKKVLFLTK